MSLHRGSILRAARELTHDKLTPDSGKEAEPDNPENDPPTGRWSLPEVKERVHDELGIEVDLRPSGEPLRSLIATGEIVRFEAGRCTEYTTPVVGMTQLSLLALIRKAAGEVDPAHEAPRGSRSADDRAVEVLTESQFQHITTACNRLGYHLSGQRRARGEEYHPELASIGSEYFVWHPDAGRRSKGDWKKLLDLVREASPPSSTSQYVGSVRRLLDLAATHAWIARTPAHDRNYAPIPTDWAPLYNRWRDELLGQHDQLKAGLMELFEACYRYDQPSPAKADWEALIPRLERRFRVNDVPSGERGVVRRTYRVAHAAGLLTGPDWDGRDYVHQGSAALVPRGARRIVAELYGKDGNQRGILEALEGRLVPWPDEWRRYPGLVEGPYGLRQWLHYGTVPPSKTDKMGMRDRGLYPRDSVRDSSGKSDDGWAIGTVGMRLEEICHCAGWMADEYNIDWSQADLRDLLDEDRLRGYKSFVEEDTEAGHKTTLKRFGTLARMASPYLEWVALDNGDDQVADRAAYLSKLISSPDSKVDGGKSWMARWRSEQDGDRIERLKRVAKRVERTWTRSNQVASCAYIQLRRVLAGRLELLEEDFGPLAAQAAAIRSGSERVTLGGVTFGRLNRSWARRVRDLIYWADQVIVPLRVGTSVRLDRKDRIENAGFTHLRARIHERKRKPDSPIWFRPNYYHGDGGYPVDLYRLYVMDQGAREVLLTLPNGRTLRTKAHYVHDMRGQAKHPRKSPDTFRSLTRRVVKTLLKRRPAILSPEQENPITFEELNGPNAVLATHMFRHAYARYWVREQDDLHTASAYLDHRDYKMLLEVYLGEDESDLDPAGKMAYLPGG